VTGVGAASTKADFKGTYLIAARGNGKVSGSGKADPKKPAAKPTAPTKTDPKKPVPPKTEPTKEPTKPAPPKTDPKKPVGVKPGPEKTDPKKPDSPKTEPKKPEPTKTIPEKTPAPETPVIVPIDPPEEPPENVFGYEEPVKGCFEGLVYPIAANSKALPTSYTAIEPISVVYACEWDIPTRDWGAGFPGVEDRFEWFAIRYAGAFHVSKAGLWSFRISSDDGTKLYIDGKLVIGNDGVHPPKEATGKVQLTEGDHEMVLEYFQGPRYLINLQVFATVPGGEEGIFSVR